MIKAITFLFVLFFATNSFAQIFEGEIIYKNTYKSNIPNLSDERLAKMIGDTQHYFIKDGNYKSVMNGSYILWQLYNNKSNKLYNKMANTDTLFWDDAAINMDEIIKSELNKGATTVLGYTCDELVLTCKNGVQKYYFNSTFLADTKLFMQHKYGNWNEYLLKANALPLKMVMETAQYNVALVATEIKPMQLDAKIFELPTDAKTMKSAN